MFGFIYSQRQFWIGVAFVITALICVMALYGQIFYRDLTFPYQELFVMRALANATLDSFANLTLPLWDTASGPGGFPNVLSSRVGWDYRLLFSLLPATISANTLIVFDLSLIFLSLWFATFRLNLIEGTLVNAIFVFSIACLFYFCFGHARSTFPMVFYNSIFIAFPVCAAFICHLENNYQRPQYLQNTFLLSFIHFFAFHGGKFEVWVLQYFVVQFLLIFLIRIFYKYPILRFRHLLIYISALALSALYNAWQINWFIGLIEESGRVTSSSVSWLSIIWETSEVFLRSPSFILFLSLVVFLLMQHLMRSQNKFFPNFARYLLLVSIVLVMCLSVIFTGSSLLDGKLDRLLVLTLAFCLIALPFREGGDTQYCWIGFGFISLFYYVFEDGALAFASNFDLFFIGIVFLFGSAQQSKLIKVSLTVLLILALLAGHVTLPMARINGVVWHGGRDTIFTSFFAMIVFLVGVKAVIARLSIWQKAVFGLLLYFSLVNLMSATTNHFSWAKTPEPLVFHKLIRELIETNLSGLDRESVLISVDKTIAIPGSFVDTGLRQVDFYDSFYPKNYKAYFLGLTGDKNDIESRCAVNFPLASSALRATIDCDQATIDRYYGSQIYSPVIEDQNSRLLDAARVTHLISSKRLDSNKFHLIDSRADLDRIVFLYRVSGDSARKPLLAQFAASDDPTCKSVADQSWVEVSAVTDYFKKGPLLAKFTIDSDLPQRGCIRLRVGYSKFWNFTLNSDAITPRVTGDFMPTFFSEGGSIRIVGAYYNEMKWLLILGYGAALFALMIYLKLILFRNDKKIY